MSATTTVPGSINVLVGETVPVGIDFTLRIATGQTPSVPTSALYDITNISAGQQGTLFTAGLSGSPTIVGNLVTQLVTGLTSGKVYRLVLGCTPSGTTVIKDGLEITCPF
jgi:hypothetical protein